MTAITRALLPVVALGAATPVVMAEITPVEPFSGALVETFNQYSSNMAVQSLPVLGGFGAFENLSPNGSIKVEFSSSLGGDLVVPISGMMSGQLGIAQWVFDEPVCCFGAWMENNSGADDATVAFYDATGALLGEMTADIPASAQQWTWNGWSSDVPFSRILVTGNGLINGFLWYENVQVEPAGCSTDVDGDGVTAVPDLVAVILAWGTAEPAADVDGSGLVDVADLTAVVLGWGPCS